MFQDADRELHATWLSGNQLVPGSLARRRFLDKGFFLQRLQRSRASVHGRDLIGHVGRRPRQTRIYTVLSSFGPIERIAPAAISNQQAAIGIQHVEDIVIEFEEREAPLSSNTVARGLDLFPSLLVHRPRRCTVFIFRANPGSPGAVNP